MSKNNKNTNKETKNKNSYKNPVETKWGKITIWVLLFGMVGTIIASAIWLIISALS